MILCPKCGKANAPLTPRCIECGQPLPSATPGPAAQPPPYAPPPAAYPPAAYPPTAPPSAAYPPAAPGPPAYVPPPAMPPPGNAPSAPYYPSQGGAAPAPPRYMPPAGAPPPPSPTPYGYVPPGAPGGVLPPPSGYCLVCGAPLPGMTYAYCPICSAPVGTIANPNDPTATTFLSMEEVRRMNPEPRAASSVLPTGIPPMTLPRRVRLTQEDPTQGWNWGASLMSTAWAFKHRVWWVGILGSLSIFFWFCMLWGGLDTSPSSPLTGAGSSSVVAMVTAMLLSGAFWLFKTLYLGMNGNRLAWNSGLYPEAEEMHKAQNLWAGWGVLISVLTIILFCAVLAMHA